MYFFPSASPFFGLTPEFRSIVHQQIHDLVYHGGGGFKHSEVYNMPIWMRHFHLKNIKEHLEEKAKQNEKLKKQYNQKPGKISGPNIQPSSTYQIKK
jgi:hypothetical protein